MSIKRAILFFLAAFLIALPLTFPASLVTRFVALPETVSHGRLSGGLLGVKFDWVQVGSLRLAEVSVRPSLTGLFSGVPLVVSVGKPIPLTAGLGGSGQSMTVAKATSATRVDTLRELLNLPGVGVDAKVDLVIAAATLVGDRCENLDGSVTLSDFSGEDFAQLDSVAASLSCANGNLVVTFSPDNALRLNGSATITPQGRYQVDMTAEPPAGPLFELFVDFLGQPRDGRRFQIRFRS